MAKWNTAASASRKGESHGHDLTKGLDGPGLGITVLPMTTITFKVEDPLARQLRAAARRAKVSLSAYLRSKVTDTPPAAACLSLTVCPLTGARIFAGSPQLPPLTTLSVRELMGDFP